MKKISAEKDIATLYDTKTGVSIKYSSQSDVRVTGVEFGRISVSSTRQAKGLAQEIQAHGFEAAVIGRSVVVA
jgi:hypothetical protein